MQKVRPPLDEDGGITAPVEALARKRGDPTSFRRMNWLPNYSVLFEYLFFFFPRQIAKHIFSFGMLSVGSIPMQRSLTFHSDDQSCCTNFAKSRS